MFLVCACTNITFQMLIRKSAKYVLTWNDFDLKKKIRKGYDHIGGLWFHYIIAQNKHTHTNRIHYSVKSVKTGDVTS